MNTPLYLSETDYQLHIHSIKDIKTYIKTILFGVKTIILSLTNLKIMTKNAASSLTSAAVSSSFQHPGVGSSVSNSNTELLLAKYTAISQG